MKTILTALLCVCLISCVEQPNKELKESHYRRIITIKTIKKKHVEYFEKNPFNTKEHYFIFDDKSIEQVPLEDFLRFDVGDTISIISHEKF